MSRICQQFREAMRKECIVVPGAFNGLVGRMVAEKGFKAAYVSGAALSASAGVPDIGVLSLDHFANRIKEIAQVSNLPLLCDADTGFGEEEMITRTTVEYINAGAAGLHLEDQVFPKRCGHFGGKTLLSQDQMCEKIKRAVQAAKDHSNGDFVICARTDARGVVDMAEAVTRAKAYVGVGADMIFPEGLQSREEFAHFAKEMQALPTPPFLLANMTEFGQTPYISARDFAKMGYHCVIFPVSTLRCAMKGVADSLDVLANPKTTMENHLESMYSREELYASIGYTPGKEWVFPNSTKREE